MVLVSKQLSPDILKYLLNGIRICFDLTTWDLEVLIKVLVSKKEAQCFLYRFQPQKMVSHGYASLVYVRLLPHFSGGNLRQIASITLSFPKILNTLGQSLIFILNPLVCFLKMLHYGSDISTNLSKHLFPTFGQKWVKDIFRILGTSPI